MTFGEHISQEDLELHAMQALSEEESAMVRAHLDECFLCQAGLAEISGDLSLVAQSVQQQAVAEGAQERFIASMASIAATAPTPRESAGGAIVPITERQNGSRYMNWVPWATVAARRYGNRFMDWISRAVDAGRQHGSRFMNRIPWAGVAARRYGSQITNWISRAAVAGRRYAGRFMNGTPWIAVEVRRYTSRFIDSIPFAEVTAQRYAKRYMKWIPWAAVAALVIVAIVLSRKVSTLNAELQRHADLAARQAAASSHAQEVLDVLTAPSAQRVLLTTSRTRPWPTGRAVYLAERGSLIFQANNLYPLRNSKAYELWVIPADGTAPIPAGLFRPDATRSASVVLPPLPKGVRAKAFGVTIEKAEGSARPTAHIILYGMAAGVGK